MCQGSNVPGGTRHTSVYDAEPSTSQDLMQRKCALKHPLLVKLLQRLQEGRRMASKHTKGRPGWHSGSGAQGRWETPWDPHWPSMLISCPPEKHVREAHLLEVLGEVQRVLLGSCV